MERYFFCHTCYTFSGICAVISSQLINLVRQVPHYIFPYSYVQFINNIRRSLRILLALARGIPIVTEEWFYTSLSCQEWMDPMPYLHARHSSQQTARGLHKPQRIFLNTKFFVGYSTNPSQIFLETILSASGGSIADNLSSSDYLIFGTYLVYCTTSSAQYIVSELEYNVCCFIEHYHMDNHLLISSVAYCLYLI